MRTRHRLSPGAALIAVLIFCASAALAQILPMAGGGSGGAKGPYLVNFSRAAALANRHVIFRHLPPPSLQFHPRIPIPAAPLQVRSEDRGVDESEWAAGSNRGAGADSAGPTIQDSFNTFWTIDIDGATDGTYIFTNGGNGLLDVYDLSGNTVKASDQPTFWCSSTPPMPICSSGVFAVDVRVFYDTGSGRWVVTALWLTGYLPATDVIAVSATGDPAGNWLLYQFPACGANNLQDSSDQPHAGFNSQWIVVDSSCNYGPGIAVFDKRVLYSGKPLTLNANWFEFTDTFLGASDNPVLTYTSAMPDREYFTHAGINLDGKATLTYSYLKGPVDAPVLILPAETVTTGFDALGGGLPGSIRPRRKSRRWAAPTIEAFGGGVSPADAPGCAACIQALSNEWIHSSGVWAFQDGTPWILSTVAMGDPAFSDANQLINIATNLKTGASKAMQLRGGADGAGPLAAEIAMALAPPAGAPDEALIVYDDSGGAFYPGVKAALWNIDDNRIAYISVLQEGTSTPTGWAASRWSDYIDAIAPIPNSDQLFLGATSAYPSSASPNSVYFATLTP